MTSCDIEDYFKKPYSYESISEVRINTDASSNDVARIILKTNDTITIYGEKDSTGQITKINVFTYQKDSTKFHIYMENYMPSKIIGENGVSISFEWITNRKAVVYTYDPGTNSFSDILWDLDNPSEQIPTNAMKHLSRIGRKLSANISQKTIVANNNFHYTKDWTDAFQTCYLRLEKCDAPFNATNWIEVYNINTDKLIDIVDYDSHPEDGCYIYHFRYDSHPATTNHQELCINIDNLLKGASNGLQALGDGHLLEYELMSAAILVGLFPPSAAVVATLAAATIVGQFAIDLFLENGGLSGYNERNNPEWYYDEHNREDLKIVPIVWTPGASDNQAYRLPAQLPEGQICYNIEGNPAITSFYLSPSHPFAEQDYTAYADYTCIPIGSTITLSIHGTDGYTDTITIQNTFQNGEITLNVPGAEAGVRDICRIQIITPTGNTFTSTASLVFGS